MEPYRFAPLFLVFFASVFGQEVYYQPEQVHLSLGPGADPTQMLATWVTLDNAGSSQIWYGHASGSLNMNVSGTSTKFTDGGSAKRSMYMHRALMTDLKPGQKYSYYVGSPYGWSNRFSFTSVPAGTNWSPRLAVYGDFGNKNAQSLGRLQQETMAGHFDAILHVGDFAYNMESDDAKYGDEFMRQIESIAAYLPYMTCPGNHEASYNFSNYKARFSMPGGDGQNMFYSFNFGPAHIIGYDSEAYYYTASFGWEIIYEQYKWLEQDLIEANKPKNRAARPWIITMGHRPMYCSNSDDGNDHCTNPENMIRVGLPYVHSYGLEELFYKYGVDLNFQAHEHSYERMWPVYNRTVCNGSDSENVYKNPSGPVHIVTGSAGCQEDTDPFFPHPFPWSAVQSDDYGYTRMQIMNSTHLYLEQVSDDKGGKVIDNMWYIKDKHGAGLYTCHQKKSKQFNM